MHLATEFYGLFIDQTVPISSSKVAESAKLMENIFRAVNIGLVNEICMISRKLGINVWEVIDAAATKPFGFMPFYPGPGLGGHCIPIDPYYLSWKVKKTGFDPRFIELAGEINAQMPSYIITLVQEVLNKQKKPLNGSRIIVFGVAYKANVSDTRESPALEVIHLLEEAGAKVKVIDPHVISFKIGEKEYKTTKFTEDKTMLKEGTTIFRAKETLFREDATPSRAS